MQWKAHETEKIMKLKDQVQQLAGGREDLEDFFDPHSSGKKNQLLGRLIVTIIEAKDLLPKSKKGGEQHNLLKISFSFPFLFLLIFRTQI